VSAEAGAHTDEHTGIAPEARMGNDIARQFAHLDADEAVGRIAAHVDRFWDPRMRRALQALAAAGDDTLDPRLAAAARRL
jgi:formate dehydrogenase subunit delta